MIEDNDYFDNLLWISFFYFSHVNYLDQPIYIIFYNYECHHLKKKKKKFRDEINV